MSTGLALQGALNPRNEFVNHAMLGCDLYVRATIWSESAPDLRKAPHCKILEARVNRVNARSEFFRVGLADLRVTVEDVGLNVTWTTAATAAEYRQSPAIGRQIGG